MPRPAPTVRWAAVFAAGALLTGCTAPQAETGTGGAERTGAPGVDSRADGSSPAPNSRDGEASGATRSTGGRQGGPRVAVYGDSISHAGSPDYGAGEFGPLSWVGHAEAAGLRFDGGYAEPGITSAELPEPREHPEADAVVYELGTNDVLNSRDWDEFAEHAEDDARRVGVDPERFVVVAVGPIDSVDEDAVRQWNERTRRLAEERGWTYADPWERLCGDDGGWDLALTFDGLHPNEQGARELADGIVEAVEELGADDRG